MKLWVIESRDRRNNGTWGCWRLRPVEAFTNRKDAVFAGGNYKDKIGESRIVKYVPAKERR